MNSMTLRRGSLPRGFAFATLGERRPGSSVRASAGRWLAVVACLAAALYAPRAHAAVAPSVIQPGSRITMGGLGCTTNWVYAGLGRLRGQQFIGTARHCVSHVGEPVYLTNGPFPVSFAPGLRIGKVAYISRAWDFALIRIEPSNFRYVVASMAGHPDIPRRVGAAPDAKIGDLCQFSGHGVPFDFTTTTQQSRVGVLSDINQNQLYCDGPAYEGDSGGPIADVSAGNAAIGVLDAVNATVGGSAVDVGIQGVTTTTVLLDATRHGYPVRVRTVTG